MIDGTSILHSTQRIQAAQDPLEGDSLSGAILGDSFKAFPVLEIRFVKLDEEKLHLQILSLSWSESLMHLLIFDYIFFFPYSFQKLSFFSRIR
jgi:hypothetical protein